MLKANFTVPITSAVIDTEADPFQKALQEFLLSADFATLEIGEPTTVDCLSKFERKYSSQRVYRVQGNEGSKRLYVKIAKNVYQKPADEFSLLLQQDFDTNRFWHNKLSSYQQFGSIRPLFLSLPYKVIITEETIGRNLGEMIRSQLRFSASKLMQQTLLGHVRRAGELLRVVQEEFKGKYNYDLRELVEDVDLRMRALVANPASHFSEELRQAVLDFYKHNRAEANQCELAVGFMHRDFTMSNLLIDGQKVIVHDFSKIDIGPRLFDVTRFYHHLGLLKYKPIYASRLVSRLQQAFLDGYQYPGQPTDLLFRFFMLRHYVSHYKGLLRDKNRSLKSKLYDHWVMTKHLRNIYRIITG